MDNPIYNPETPSLPEEVLLADGSRVHPIDAKIVSEGIWEACSNDSDSNFYHTDSLITLYFAMNGSPSHVELLDQKPSLRVVINDILDSAIFDIPEEEKYTYSGKLRRLDWPVERSAALKVFFNMVVVEQDETGAILFSLKNPYA